MFYLKVKINVLLKSKNKSFTRNDKFPGGVNDPSSTRNLQIQSDFLDKPKNIFVSILLYM